MSFISFKRQLSADLERMSSRNHGNKSAIYPQSASTFRKLGNTSQNWTKPVRRIKPDERNRNSKQGCVPAPPPPSRREILPPFLENRKQGDCTSEDDILRHNIVENYSDYYQIRSFSPDRPDITAKNRLRYSTVDSLYSRGLLSKRENVLERKLSSTMDQNAARAFLTRRENIFSQNCSSAEDVKSRHRVFLPSKKKISGFSYHRNTALPGNRSDGTLAASNCLRRRFGTRYEIADRGKEPTIRLVVNLPKIEMVKPVTFSYKHGKL